jgi:LPS export ABC transporter protein LptC
MIEKRPKTLGVLHLKKLGLIGRALICSALFVTLLVACNQEKPLKISAFKDRSSMPQLHATEVTTVISDSGITRYRISTPQWDVFDRAAQPYWEFPKGIHLERFNPELKVDANIHSNYAKFNQNEKIWELKGKVRMINLQGELFETEHLFWNQNQERIYSDTLVKITKAQGIINALSFESNQSMTRYSFRNATGPIVVPEEKR